MLFRSDGDSIQRLFYDTIKGGDFRAREANVYRLAQTSVNIIDQCVAQGVPLAREYGGLLDNRSFGGAQVSRTFYARGQTGQQLLLGAYQALARQVHLGTVELHHRTEMLDLVTKDGRAVGVVARDLITGAIRSFSGHAVVLATGGNGLIYGRSTMSMVCTGSAVSRAYRAGAWYGNGEFIQVHPTAIPGADKLRLMSESARGEGGRVWVPRKPQDPRDPRDIPEGERYYFLEERYPKYGNLVPRDIATREIFDICTTDGLSVEKDRLCVYLDLTHLSREMLDRKLGGILEIYEKFQGVDPRSVPMKIFPAVHYSMGGLWVDYQKSASGGLEEGSPRNQQTSIPGLYAIGECDYQYHGANRLGANSLLSCIFSGLFCAPGVIAAGSSIKKIAAEESTRLFDAALRRQEERHEALLARRAGNENPYDIHQSLGNLMTRVATVVRRNEQLVAAYDEVCGLEERWRRCSLSDTGNWTNQNVVFTKALGDMFPVAKLILKGALLRDECRGAHYKPATAMPGIAATDPAGQRREAEEWCDRFEANTRKWLKSTIAKHGADGHPQISYEDVDTSLIPPRPRLYGLVGAEVIEEVWKERQKKGAAGNGHAATGTTQAVGAAT